MSIDLLSTQTPQGSSRMLLIFEESIKMYIKEQPGTLQGIVYGGVWWTEVLSCDCRGAASCLRGSLAQINCSSTMNGLLGSSDRFSHELYEDSVAVRDACDAANRRARGLGEHTATVRFTDS